MISLTRFSPIAVFTSGQDAIYPGFQYSVDGIALVTKFMASEGWLPPDPIVTGWTQCCAPVSTSWTDAYSTPTTTWSAA